MTEQVVTAAPATPVHRVAELMRDRNVGSVVLADDSGKPVGMITDRDLTIEEAAGLMVGHRIRRLPVMDGESLVGIVTLDDIAVRTGNLEVAQQMTAEVAKAVFPEFYFHQRGG